MSINLKKVIDKTLDASAIIALAAMTILVAVNVFFRFVLKSSLSWGDEMASILMVWLTFLGAAIATRERSHYKFKYLVQKLKGTPLKIYLYTRNTINIITILLLGFYSVQVAIEIHSWIMPATEISRTLVYGACPLGCFFMLFYSIEHFIQDIKKPF